MTNTETTAVTNAPWAETLRELARLAYGIEGDIPEHFVFLELAVAGRPTVTFDGARHIGSSETASLRICACDKTRTEDGALYTLTQSNDILTTKTYYRFYDGIGTVHVCSDVRNTSAQPITLEYVSSYVDYGFWQNDYDDVYLYYSSNGWYGEAQWARLAVRDLGIFTTNNFKSMKKFEVSNTGTWSTKSHLPMGILENERTGQFLLWQIEANGSWEWELGELHSGITLNISGPTMYENGWKKVLAPGETFRTTGATVTRASTLNDVLADITRYRRRTRVKRNDADELPIIFNEYMFAAWETPNEENTRRMADAVAQYDGVGYYVIDCGWHDEENAFNAMGKWRESRTRFPSGLKNTMAHIASLGMKPGLWMEPEVVGALGDGREIWTDDCFFRKDGKPYVVSNRYQLDFRNPKVPAQLNAIIDRLIREYGLGYMKLDYNIEPCLGPEDGCASHGDGLLAHCRAVAAWQKALGERYPDLIIETCASGGNRLDGLTAKYANLISTSDQMSYYRYSYIVGNILSAVLPEQAAVWNYPLDDRVKPEDVTQETVAHISVNSLLGRMHFSSRVDRLDEAQRALVQEALTYYTYMTPYKKESVPYLPKGFTRWNDSFIATGIRTEKKCFLAVFNMNGVRDIELPLPGLRVKSVCVGYPRTLPFDVRLDGNTLGIHFGEDVQARLLELDLA